MHHLDFIPIPPLDQNLLKNNKLLSEKKKHKALVPTTTGVHNRWCDAKQNSDEAVGVSITKVKHVS